jgi:hypothetical protein
MGECLRLVQPSGLSQRAASPCPLQQDLGLGTVQDLFIDAKFGSQKR